MTGPKLLRRHRQLEALGVRLLLPAQVIQQPQLDLEAPTQPSCVCGFVVVQVTEDVADRGQVGPSARRRSHPGHGD
jgi:hypothetical protein